MSEFRILDRFLLTKGLSSSDAVYHLVLENTSLLEYQVGGVLGVYPENDPEVVSKVLNLFSLPDDFLIFNKKKNEVLTARNFLSRCVNLSKFSPTFKRYLLSDRASCFYSGECSLNSQFSCYEFDFYNCFSDLFLPLLPRFYSIASAPLHSQKTLDLTVRLVAVRDHSGKFLRYGTCSDYLCRRTDVFAYISAFVKPSPHFTLTKDVFGKPIVMIGAGTGIAPYRAFLQHRLAHGDPGCNILIFGERASDSDFYYQNFWNEHVEQKKLRLFTAFSRDQEEKTYVQQRLLEQHSLVYETLLKQGGHIFVCGSKAMGMEIRRSLTMILGKNDLEKGKSELYNLSQAGRYSVDLY